MTNSFLNKNWYRKYPFRATSSLLSVDESLMDNSLVVGCSLSLSSRSNPDVVSVSRVTATNSNVHVEFSWDGEVVAVGSGRITRDNQTLALIDKTGNPAGHCVIGSRTLVDQLNHSYRFTGTNGLLESSCVKYHPAPKVTGLIHNGVTATGKLLLELTNLKLVQIDGKLLINVSSLQQVNSRGDKTSQWLTCDNAVITGINDVKPEPGTGLIELYGISPVTVTVTANGIQVGLVEGVSLDTLCKDINTPAASNSNEYKGYLEANDPERNVLTTNDPEWKDWPQYND